MKNIPLHTLLGRPARRPLFDLSPYFKASCVMVTGAGGSIGSELCVQLIALEPKVLILVDKDEFALYMIERKLRELNSATQIVPVLASILDENRMSTLLGTFDVEYVFHAAAYKHVPLVERNPAAGILNNTIGTHVLASLCREHKVKHFLLVSTDKAVNPTNVMGASKRLAEYAALSLNGGDTVFSTVRFGNVLWSSGSVLPLFYRQLEDKQPVTITHKDVTRYFMSISEAVMLMMESLCFTGNIKVLDMGEQVRIEDMAHRLATAMGVPEFPIEYIGLRDGEKLYEELTLGDKLHPTEHPDIQQAQEDIPEEKLVAHYLTIMKPMCDYNDIGTLRALLQQIVPGYNPACGIVDEVWVQAQFKRLNVLSDMGDCYEHTAA